MSRTLATPLVGVLLAASACDDAEIKRPICDPSDPAAGRVALEVAGGGQFAPGQAVQYDNGAPYLFVDGQCNYWVNDPDVWKETRTGVLDAETAAELGARLHVGAWRDLSGAWLLGGAADAPNLILDDSTSAVVCAGFCDGPDVPAAVRAVWDAFPIVARELWERGSAAESNVRAAAISTERFQGVPFVDWPLTRPISDFMVTGGTLEDDVASVQALKELRASFVRGDHGTFMRMLPVTSNGAYYQLYMRDTLPFEDEHGFVQLTGVVAEH